MIGRRIESLELNTSEFETCDARAFQHAFQDHIRDMRFSADAGGVPNALAVPLRRISPGGLAFLEPLLDDELGFSEQHRDFFARMEPIADEKWDQHNIFGASDLIAFCNPGILLEEYWVNFRVFSSGANALHLALNGGAGVFIALGAVSGDEQSNFRRLGRAGK